jgi:N-acetylglucosaminyldiphosphoundecaprenol N-acetyl-beta-D-mannosaminyltransferase
MDVLGLPVWAIDTPGLIRLLLDRAVTGVPSRVCYVNAHTWALARRDRSFHEVLATSDVLYPDGMSWVWASRVLGRPLPARLSAADYIEDFALAAAARGVSLYLLGGAASVAERAAQRLVEVAPGLCVSGTADGFFDLADSAAIIDRINRSEPGVLLVGMGSPRQERWAAENQDKLDAPVIWSVGALFDYLADAEWRAPRWMCQNGLEWAFRLMMDPRGKAGRYLLGNPLFVASVGRAWLAQMLWREKDPGTEVHVG